MYKTTILMRVEKPEDTEKVFTYNSKFITIFDIPEKNIFIWDDNEDNYIVYDISGIYKVFIDNTDINMFQEVTLNNRIITPEETEKILKEREEKE